MRSFIGLFPETTKAEMYTRNVLVIMKALLILLHMESLTDCLNVSIDHYQRLWKELMENGYDRNLRPVRDYRTVTNIRVEFGLQQLHMVREVEKVIEAFCHVDLKWYDDYLKWNPEDYGGLTMFRYPYKYVWKPEFLLFNSAELEDDHIVEKASTNLIVRYDGHVVNSFIALFKATCPAMDMTHFPFDQQICYFRFGSWTHSANEIAWLWRSYDVPESLKSLPHSEWEYDLFNYSIVSELYCCPNETYQFIDIRVRLKRKPLYYLFNLILPTVIIAVVAILGMFSPTNSGGERTEKVGLGMATLLSISVLMLSVSEKLPVNSESVSTVCWILQSFVLLIATATLMSVAVLSLENRGLRGHAVPEWAKIYIIDGLGKYLLCPRIPQPARSFTVTTMVHECAKFAQYSSRLVEAFRTENTLALKIMALKLERIEDLMHKMVTERAMQEQVDDIRLEWNNLATVVERVLLMFYLLVGITAPCLLLRFEIGRPLIGEFETPPERFNY